MTNKVESKLRDEKDAKRNLCKPQDNEDYDYITIPPDGGYGWVVLIACFMINLIVDGFLYAFGAISETLRKEFDCHEWEVTLVSSLACGFYLLSAPIASALSNKYGCRKIGIIGSVIAALAVAASTRAPNIYIMWLLFGCIGGIGMGLVYLPSIIMVGYYFEEKRAIATGIVTAGTGIGSIIFGPMSRILFDVFGWKIAVLILSAILLCCVICCIFMRPLQPIRKRRVLPSSDLVDDNVFNDTTSSPLINETKAIHTPDSNFSEVTIEQEIKKRSRTNSAISTKSRQSIKAEDAVRPLYKEDVLYQGDTKDLPEYTSQPDIPTYIQQTTKVPETVEKTKMKAFWDILLSMADFNILTDKKMLIICLANVCSMIGFYSPYLFIPKLAELERSIPKASAVFLLSIIGFSNTAGRFASGYITKIPYMSPLLVNNIGLIVAGIATLLVPLCQTHIHLIIYCIIWGGFIAFHVSLSLIIVCQTVGLERYSNALGLTLMFRGITALSAPPIMGAIRDATNSFDIAFIIGGISFITSALMYFYLMWINRREEEQLNRTKKINNIQRTPASLDI
ncbi:unnamed protein product [Adineta steineri]|uniref:Major facilitator superfamily (MFS) profile domain-containing protein n=2 Tax=Adineta steineri TaxID=433720 RepID=A0A818IH37_9BILA|nr:unnamed protein product [Adineta steineri]CAF3523313.1 unnamed protein product [Adineta steineri]